MKVAIYPGSFDPITNGHIDIITRSLKLFDKLIVAVVRNPNKRTLFPLDERVSMIKKVLKKMKKVQIEGFDGLLVDYVRDKKAKVIIRGLRALSDFEYEFQMELMNRKLYKDVEIVYMMPRHTYTYLSSSIMKEIVSFGGNPKGLIPLLVYKCLREKLNK